MLIEADRCVGCQVCTFACKDEFEGNAYPPYSAAQPRTSYTYTPKDYPEPAAKLSVSAKPGQFWMAVEGMVTGKFPNVKAMYIPQPCGQCEDAPCVKNSKDGAAYMRPDGIIVIDPAKSRGQVQIVGSCPYGRVYWNEEANIPQKCTFCTHLVSMRQNPRCVDACPVGAITFGDLEDPNSTVSFKIRTLKAERLKPELGLNTKVYYSGLSKLR